MDFGMVVEVSMKVEKGVSCSSSNESSSDSSGVAYGVDVIGIIGAAYKSLGNGFEVNKTKFKSIISLGWVVSK